MHDEVRDPFCERGDGQRRVHGKRRWDDRAIGDVQAVVHGGAASIAEHPAAVVDHSAFGIVTHVAAAERMDRHERVRQQSVPQRVVDVSGAVTRRQPREQLVVRNGLPVGHSRPREVRAAGPVDRHDAAIGVVGHQQERE